MCQPDKHEPKEAIPMYRLAYRALLALKMMQRPGASPAELDLAKRDLIAFVEAWAAYVAAD